MEPLRVLLVDDHVLFRKGLASLMASRPEVQVVGEAADGMEALEKTRELRPELVLMDINMPGHNGLWATRLIKQEMPRVRIVMLTVSDEEEDLFEAIKSGAQGYLLKNLRPESLFELLKGVSKGESPVSPVVAAKILKEFKRQVHEAPVPSPGVALTSREREVLQLVASGASNKEIAAHLHITEGTVKNHLHNVLEKLHLENRVQAAAYVLRQGIIDGPSL